MVEEEERVIHSPNKKIKHLSFNRTNWSTCNTAELESQILQEWCRKAENKLVPNED